VAEVANLDESETRMFEHGTVQTAKVGSLTVTRGTMQPGWRWSSDVKPIVGTDSCMVHHTGVAVAGRLHIVMDDGSEIELGPGDAHDIPPGHDAWVVGDEPYIGIDFSAEMAEFAKPS
jgi:mannose-6-phosphate isomerase-like protein (cupin superfamily)